MNRSWKPILSNQWNLSAPQMTEKSLNLLLFKSPNSFITNDLTVFIGHKFISPAIQGKKINH
jgi:hypothetical protein